MRVGSEEGIASTHTPSLATTPGFAFISIIACTANLSFVCKKVAGNFNTAGQGAALLIQHGKFRIFPSKKYAAHLTVWNISVLII